MSAAARTALTSTTIRTAIRATPASTSLSITSITRPIAPTSLLPVQQQLNTLHTHSPLRAPEPSDNPGAMPDGLADKPAKGTTGGGEALDSSAKNSAPKPKISNASVPGVDGTDKLTEEQRKEVEEHNREFDEKHDRGNVADDDKVDKKFWSDDRGKE